jgi:translation initiation factor IF-1
MWSDGRRASKHRIGTRIVPCGARFSVARTTPTGAGQLLPLLAAMWHTSWFGVVLSKDDLIDMQGTVVAVHSGGLYRVQTESGHEVLAQLSGRMRRFRIKVVPGDRVTVGVSPYDPVRGIITFRAR